MNNRKRNNFKAALRRAPRFSDIEVWNLCDVLARIIYAGLYQFKHMKRHTVPVGENGKGIPSEEWEAMLDKMLFTFKEASTDYPSCPMDFGEKQAAYNERIQEGGQLFIKYFGSLWD